MGPAILLGGSPSSLEVTITGPTISGNSSGYEASAIGGWSNGNPLTIDVVNPTIDGNSSPGGAAVQLSGTAVFSTTNIDFGVGADDNGPADVMTPGGPMLGLGAGESFVCSSPNPC